MQPADLSTWIEPSDPAVSPDGRQVAFVVTTIDLDENRYRSRIWLAPTDGSAPPRPLTVGEHRDARPRWSPDGAWVAFVSHRDEPGSELYVLPVDGGEPLRLLSCPEEIEALAWAPGSDRLAITARERDEAQYAPEHDRDRPPRRVDRLAYRLDGVGFTADRFRHVWTVDVPDGTHAKVTTGDFHHGAAVWVDPDTIVCTAARTPTWDIDDVVDLYAFPVSGGAPRCLTDCGGTHHLPAVSDTGAIAYAHSSGHVAPTHNRVATVGGCDLTEALDRNAPSGLAPVWDGDTILFTADDGGNVPLLRVDPTSGEISTVVGGERRVTGASVGGGTLVITVQSPDRFAQVVVVDGDDERALTDYEVPFPVVVPERFSVGDVDAWLLRPSGTQGPRATLLNIHGGPFTQYGGMLFDEFQVQAAAGYAVLWCNPRGSSGGTEAWGRAIRGPDAEIAPGSGWGGVDAEDILAVVDAAIERYPDVVDPARIGVLGGSYGGYMTTWLIGHTDRFVAALADRALTNMVTFCHTSDIGATFPGVYVGASHLDAMEEFVQQSPVTYADRITTPLLLLHSERDLRCPIEQAEDLFVRLKHCGREVELVRMPGEGHELSRSGAPKHRVQRFEVLLEFFGRHLPVDD